MNAGEPPRTPGESRMTLRVYTASRDGTVTEERGEVRVMGGEPVDVYSLMGPWPPCGCPHYRRS